MLHTPEREIGDNYRAFTRYERVARYRSTYRPILARASVGRVVIYPPNGLGDSNDLYNEAGQSNQRKALTAIRARIDRAPYLISVLGQLGSLEKRF